MKFQPLSFLIYRFRRLADKIEDIRAASNRRAYVKSARLPWSRGYDEYKWSVIEKTLADTALMRKFENNGNLPANYGPALDERVVEYPWALSKIPPTSGLEILDAGSTLNYRPIIKSPYLKNQRLTIANLNPEKNCFYKQGVSYQLADIRSLPFKNETFNIITCLSTLEHVGMDNALYTGQKQAGRPGDFSAAVAELKRVLKTNGKLLITVPFGKYENHGFFQQFDSARVEAVRKIFGGQSRAAYYKYSSAGWQVAEAEDCKDAEYFDVRKHSNPAPDRAAASRAIACLLLTK